MNRVSIKIESDSMGRSLLRLLLPPIVLKLKPKELFVRFLLKRVQGYESLEISRIVYEKNIQLRERLRVQCTLRTEDFPILAAVGFAKSLFSDPINIVDFGGGGGTHYFPSRKIYGSSIGTWKIIETTSMVDTCRKLNEPGLEFVDSKQLDSLFTSTIDLMLTSTALQYVNDPKEQLDMLLRLKPKSIFISRVAVSDNLTTKKVIEKSFLSDHGPGVAPSHFNNYRVTTQTTAIPRQSLETALSKEYEIVLQVNEGVAAFHAGKGVTLWSYFAILRHDHNDGAT